VSEFGGKVDLDFVQFNHSLNRSMLHVYFSTSSIVVLPSKNAEGLPSLAAASPIAVLDRLLFSK